MTLNTIFRIFSVNYIFSEFYENTAMFFFRIFVISFLVLLVEPHERKGVCASLRKMRLASGSAQNNAFSHGLADFDEHGTGCRGCACSAFSSTICMILSKSIRTSRPQLCSENVFSF